MAVIRSAQPRFASFGNDLAMPGGWGACMDVGGKYAGTISGTMNMAGQIGGALGPIVVGVAVVVVSGLNSLDPIIAIIVAINILWTGVKLLRRSALGLLDATLPAAEHSAIQQVLSRYEREGVHYHALRTRYAGSRSFISFHVLVPGDWTVQRGHDLLEQVERDIRAAVPGATVFTHLEPIGDPAALQDISLDR